MQAVPTVEFGVLQRVDDVETPAPGRHQQGEDDRDRDRCLQLLRVLDAVHGRTHRGEHRRVEQVTAEDEQQQVGEDAEDKAEVRDGRYHLQHLRVHVDRSRCAGNPLLHGLHALHHFGRHHLRHRKRPYDAQRAPDQHLHDGNRRHAEYLAQHQVEGPHRRNHHLQHAAVLLLNHGLHDHRTVDQQEHVEDHAQHEARPRGYH